MIIGLSGYARAGKDSVADRLVISHGFVKMAFADPLKEAVYRLDPYVPTLNPFPERLSVVIDSLGYEEAKDQYPEIRRLLQRMGTEVGREMFGEDFWVEQVRRRIADEVGRTGNTDFVLPDCRFESEAQAVKRWGGQVWRIHRPGTTPVNAHASEVGLDDWTFDRHLINETTVAALHERVDHLVGLDG